MNRTIDFFVFPGFQLLDLTGPLTVFHSAGTFSPENAYTLRILSLTGGPITSTSGVPISTVRATVKSTDTLIIAGGRGSRMAAIDPACITAVRRLSDRSRRVASVCTGAFILAASGLLDGYRATTHWRAAAELRRQFPNVDVDGEKIYIKQGRIWSSAGITAGIDLALALVEEDLGVEVSRAVAQELVVYHRRPGGQSQFSALLDLAPESDRMRRALSFIREHLSEEIVVRRIAEEVCLSERQFGRAFREETGETPAKAVERLRAEAARPMVESTSEPIEEIALRVGFADPERMRRAFLRLFGHPPQALRRASRLSGRR